MSKIKAYITIPDVTGDISISINSVVEEFPALYTGNPSKCMLNTRFDPELVVYYKGGTSYGRYISELVPLDCSKKPYMNVSGFYNGQDGSGYPVLNKIILYKDGKVARSDYYPGGICNDPTISNYSFSTAAFVGYDAIRFEMLPVPLGTSITESDVISTDVASIILSDEPLY